jgi:hypothetical protein
MKFNLIAASAIAAALIMPALAQDDSQGPPTPAAVEQMQLASTLARYGEARRDPVLLLAAAKIAKGMTPDAPPPSTTLPNLTDMLNHAEEYSNGDETVMGEINTLRDQQSKAYCYGPYGTGWC